MKKIIIIILALFPLWGLEGLYAQKELWGVNTGSEYSEPASYFGNITKYDINGDNPVIMHEFDSIHGYFPKGRLFLASNGKLYGTTIKGGNYYTSTAGNVTSGTLFEYDLTINKYNVINYFSAEASSYYANPDIGVIEPQPGVLCGASQNRIYKYTIATGNITFSNPLTYFNSIHGELMKASDGNIYGTSYYGICSSDNPNGPYLGNYIKYNITTNTVNFINPQNTSCEYITRGAAPITQLVETSPGKLLGSCWDGGIYASFDPQSPGGTLLELDIATNTFTKKIDFNHLVTGSKPRNIVPGDNGKYYGICEEGGVPQTCNNPTYNFGTLYEYTPTTNVLEVKQIFSFCGNTVRYPTSIMRTSLGHFIGTIPLAGLFKYDAVTNTITQPNYTINNPNLYNTLNIIEICRKPFYQEIVVNTFDGCIGGTFTYDVHNTNASSYQWQLNNVNVVGQTTGILNLTNLQTTNAGTYTCVMTNECGTTTTMPLTLTVNCLGIDNPVANLDKNIKLYPNPTSNYLNIELPKNIEVSINSIKVSDMLGKEVLHLDGIPLRVGMTKVDVAALAKGVYILSLKTNYGNWNGKFVKE